jgi:hypothetical protein
VPDNDEPDLRERLARQLGDCRQRGIERLDVASSRQRRLKIPDLERLATDYASANGLPDSGRIGQIKALLLDALDALEKGNASDANLIRDLFFGEDTTRIKRSASELLKRTQLKYGEPSAGRFLEIRRGALRNFAVFLVKFASAPAFLPPVPAPSRGDVGLARLAAILQFSLEDPGNSKKLTIDEHQKIIDKHGHCWWGWFRAVHDPDYSGQIAERLGNCDVGLWERSEDFFYVARCDAVVAGDGQAIRSPEPRLTPDYYRSQPLPAWFSLSSIRESTRPQFEERFGDLPNTRSTIYWDSGPKPEPLIVPALGNAILHVSDLRFDHGHRWSTINAPRRSISTAEQAIIQTLQLGGVDLASIAVVVICGNFATKAPTAEAYHEALAFIDELCDQLPNIERQHIVIVPGADDFARPGNRDQATQVLYREFYERLYGDAESDISQIRQYLSEDLVLNVLPVNSVKRLGREERGEGFFGSGYDTQLRVMLQEYLHYHRLGTRIVNVVAAHHHLISTSVELPETEPRRPAWTRALQGICDAGEVLARLNSNRVALYLHGHLHEAAFRIVTSGNGWQTAVCGAGTAGASDGWLRNHYRRNRGNSFTLYKVGEDRISGEMFAIEGEPEHSSAMTRFELVDNPGNPSG